MPVTNPYEFDYAGLLMGGETAYAFAEAVGLVDQPDLRVSDRTRLRRHGMLPGDDFLGGRSVVLSFEVFGADDAAFQANVDAFKAAMAPGNAEAALTFKVPGVAGGGTRLLRCRPRKLSLPVDRDRFFYRMPVAAVELFATDPRLYDNTESSLQTTLPTAGGGLTFNATFNATFGAVSTGGSIFATNAGTFPTSPVLRIDGPCTNPSIENVGTGEKLSLSADGGLALAGGEFVVVNVDARTILLGGTASRYSKLSPDSTWFDLKPGTTELKFRAVTGTTATLTVTWRSAWL